jgi:hypothetical protein
MEEGGSHSHLERKLVGWMCVGHPRKAAVALDGWLWITGRVLARDKQINKNLKYMYIYIYITCKCGIKQPEM